VSPPASLPAPAAVPAAAPPKNIEPPVILPTTTQTTGAQTELTPRREPPAALLLPPKIVTATASRSTSARSQLQSAYRAFASGDLDVSERVLTSILDATPSGEAYLLRGCTRYTRAMLSRSPEPMLAAAKSDFKTALKKNRALHLDRNAFSPKLIAFFEEVRKGG
jgi:hypothetical protein